MDVSYISSFVFLRKTATNFAVFPLLDVSTGMELGMGFGQSRKET